MKSCASCRADLREDDRFCSKCGTYVPLALQPLQSQEKSIDPVLPLSERAGVIGAAIMGALFPSSIMARHLGKAVGRRVGVELERGTPFVAIGVSEEDVLIGEMRARRAAEKKSKKRRRSSKES